MTLQRVSDLIKLANDGDEESEEARTAAVKAARLIKDNKLVLVPQSELERVERQIEGVRNALAKNDSDKTMHMAMAAVAGFFAAKRGML